VQHLYRMDDVNNQQTVEVTADNYDKAVYDALVGALSEMQKATTFFPNKSKHEAYDIDPEQVQGNHKTVRNLLKNLLCVVRSDFSEEFCHLMDSILLYERSLIPPSKFVFCTDLQDMNQFPDLQPCKIHVWQGDITKLKVNIIVNAANNYVCGCFTPGHMCIDNVIHDKAGPRLRMECRQFMLQQKHLEHTGKAKITKAYCLPSDHVLHTVGPIAEYRGHEQPGLLASSYTECLKLAKEHNQRTIAFCCISTGVFGYPQLPAAKVALTTVRNWLLQAVEPGTRDNSSSSGSNENKSSEDNDTGNKNSTQKLRNKDFFDSVIFNVFKNEDLDYYSTLAPTIFWFVNGA